ncbi:polyadenylate-binding protein-interacting protein [Anaeramoeba flamelloides]|uniref:Polyadenylate-binding protein-interacting protein n=1 Tax=Anaeramoeba flamelloides TaxID=1746091 RepID=A0AAV7ZSE8_9EUKA|nr:polyadenylate-binding protein-interacting protein [Anaeramoeba flamelloides]
MSNQVDPKTYCTVFVTSIDVSVSEEQLIQFFGSCGTIAACKLCGDTNHAKRFAFIEFTSQLEAQKALGLSGSTLGFYSLQVHPSKTAIKNPSYINPNFQYQSSEDQKGTLQQTIYIKNIDSRVTEFQLQGFFEKTCGNINKIVLRGDTRYPTRFGFIEFSNVEAANNALMLTGTIIGEKKLTIVKSTQPIKDRSQFNTQKDKSAFNGQGYTSSDNSDNMIGQQKQMIQQQQNGLDQFKPLQEKQNQQQKLLKQNKTFGYGTNQQQPNNNIDNQPRQLHQNNQQQFHHQQQNNQLQQQQQQLKLLQQQNKQQQFQQKQSNNNINNQPLQLQQNNQQQRNQQQQLNQQFQPQQQTNQLQQQQQQQFQLLQQQQLKQLQQLQQKNQQQFQQQQQQQQQQNKRQQFQQQPNNNINNQPRQLQQNNQQQFHQQQNNQFRQQQSQLQQQQPNNNINNQPRQNLHNNQLQQQLYNNHQQQQLLQQQFQPQQQNNQLQQFQQQQNPENLIPNTQNYALGNQLKQNLNRNERKRENIYRGNNGFFEMKQRNINKSSNN